MGWFWAEQEQKPTPRPACPMHRSTPPDFSKIPGSSNATSDNDVNHLNLMFSSLPQSRAPGQSTRLPTERETSSIPRGDSGLWEYPSPQQMYNAMRRKGYDDTPEDAVESMVAVHNFLNEGAWGEIVGWEKRFGGGVLSALLDARERDGVAEREREGFPRLVKFQGKSREMTPKARMFQVLGRIYPERFGGPPPFDRHDWYVLRQGGREVRYVIDYYSAPPEPTGEPVFYLDVRPAIDRPSAILEIAMVWGEDLWERASGADVRRAAAEKAKRESS
ncbi:cytochrome c and c1 heme-lyase [Tuber magnatum]|uniref:Holocytochrome c-type synthase n=1 Tax=Tuber magnatum TaxID=42249 RepID=A0A317SR32_9PEZI|nr:cytochrome c and c1 heme-lyase [Tuber magnatum]